MKIYNSCVTFQNPPGTWAVICLLVQRQETHLYLFILWLELFLKLLQLLQCTSPPSKYVLKQSYICKSVTFTCPPLHVGPLCSSLSHFLFFPLSPLYPFCSVHSLLMSLIWTVSLWATGMASVLLLSFKRAVGQIPAQPLCSYSVDY